MAYYCLVLVRLLSESLKVFSEFFKSVREWKTELGTTLVALLIDSKPENAHHTHCLCIIYSG
jgi:hypothetical protein